VPTTIGERIAHIRGDKSQAAFAKEIGAHKNSIGNYERGERTPDAGFLAKLMEAGYNANWLLTGEGPMLLADMSAAPSAVSLSQSGGVGDDYALIPLYDVCAAAGHGSLVNSEEVADTLVFKRSWIHQELHAQPNDLYLIHVDGESMEPTLRPGDVILVDRRSAASVPRDGIYVIRMSGGLLVKRLQHLPGRKVRATSDNPAYAAFDIELDAPGEDLAIIGRVIWAGRRM
tara:strand:+ start:4195 stop:4884 length:690 start_codon:yes stop_codon:yes gene_type:complete